MQFIKINDLDIGKSIENTVATLKSGGLVVVPTDTVYGLAADAACPKAITKLINFKSRPAGKPISVFVHDLKKASDLVAIDKKQREVLSAILPASYTVVLASKHKVDRRLESEKGSLGIRYINHPFINRLTSRYPHPITATSANLSGRSPDYSIGSLLNVLSEKKKNLIDLIIDFGQLPRHRPSTVIDMTEGEVKVLRQGFVKYQQQHKYITKNEAETKKLASNILRTLINKKSDKPLVFILQGQLGSGKTQFVKGIAECLGINNIISPTFVVYYEYKIPANRLNLLYHVDLYNISEKTEFVSLGFENMLHSGNIICMEWGEKSGEIFPMLKQQAYVVSVTIEYAGGDKRKIVITNFQ